jgi:hypothetical protein
MRGGKRPGSGRPSGKPNKRSEAHQEAVARAAAVVEQALPEAFHGDAHALLMMVYKDQGQPIQTRIDAAGKAIGYEKPKLASVDNTGDAVKRAVVRVPPKEENTAEWLKHYAPRPMTN